jgi:excisionase family DNA binding protein
MPGQKEEFLTVEETAKRLKLSIFTLRDYLRAGKVPGIKVGRHWRVPESALTEMGAQANRTVLGPILLADPSASDEEIENAFRDMHRRAGASDEEIEEAVSDMQRRTAAHKRAKNGNK